MGLSDLTWRARAVAKRLDEYTGGEHRYVDMGVRLYVVDQDPDGVEVFPGKPHVRPLRVHEFGGVWDRALGVFISKSTNPARWFCGEAQETLLLHRREEVAPRVLAYGSMGGGKTELLSMWSLLRALEFAGSGCFGFVGLTAPTEKRLRILIDKLRSKMPDNWYVWRERDHEFRLACNITLQLRAAKSASEATSSPIQGYDWMAAGSDELQDALDSDAYIESRGRAAPGGYYRRMNTVTAKDSPSWRAWRDEKAGNPLWEIRHMAGPQNPFVAREYWEDLKLSLSPRDYRRMVLALDVGPERATYPTFDRDRHLRPWPIVGARDVTESIVGPGRTVLVGHDPGKIQNVSILLKAYEIRGEAGPIWVAIGEVTTSGTTEVHCHALHQALEPWLQPGERAMVRCDPHGNGQDSTDRTVYTVFRNAGFEIRAAAYKATTKTAGPTQIKREARIDMVCTMLLNVQGETRLYFAADDRGKPMTPKLLNSLEMAERDEAGKAEAQKKGKADTSHWSVSLGYALWSYERPRIDAGRKAA